MVEFVCSYEFDGQEWTLTLFATTHEEAEMKLRAIGKGSVDGVLIETIPADDPDEPNAPSDLN